MQYAMQAFHWMSDVSNAIWRDFFPRACCFSYVALVVHVLHTIIQGSKVDMVNGTRHSAVHVDGGATVQKATGLRGGF